MNKATCFRTAAIWIAACIQGMAAEIIFENARLRGVLGADAAWQSLIDKPSGKEYVAARPKVSLAFVRIGGKTHSAKWANRTGDRLTVALADCDTRLTYVHQRRPLHIQPQYLSRRHGEPAANGRSSS